MTARFRTALSLPLLGMAPDAVLGEAWSALEADARVESLQEVTPCAAPDEPVEHVELSVILRATSLDDAHRSASELHDIALRRIQALLPADAKVGWMSGYAHPEPV